MPSFETKTSLATAEVRLREAGYNFEVRQKMGTFKNSEEEHGYIIGLADTIDNAKKLCDTYCTSHPGAQLQIWDYDNKTFIVPG